MEDYTGIEFLDKLYQNLYMSDEVQHTKEKSDNRKEAIQKYMDRLERIHKKADTETKKELLYNLYFDKYVIKEEDIPYEAYKDVIINAQKKSLGMWLEYLSNPAADYPTWAKYWVFQGMLKMGSYDENKEIYLKRDKKTIAPFVSANPEIIAKSIETITNLVKGEEVTTDTLEKLSKTDSFNKIYSLFEKKYKENIVKRSDNNDGIWKKYNQGSKEDAIKLSKSLENKNTGWCTASEDVAIKQVCGPYGNAHYGGDFYVYYTKDKDGKYTIPRIAIRLNETNSIGEIRGIEDGQNLEEVMEGILDEQLRKMSFLKKGDIDNNLKIIDGLRELTRIGKKTEKKEDLTEEELNNLYERKYGFGWTQDPRVEKIQEKRNIMEDYNKIKDKKIKVKFLTYGMLPKGTQINDKEIVLEALKKNGSAFNYASEELQNDREIVLEAVKKNKCKLENISKKFRNDKEIVLEALKRDASALKYVSEELQNDKEIVLEAVKRYRGALKYASEELRNDKEVILEPVKQYRGALQYASEEQRDDKEIVLEAVKKNGSALQYASEELRNDKEIVLEALKTNPRALKYASKELRNDKEIVLAAVKRDGSTLNYVLKKLKSDKEVVLEAVKNSWRAIEYIPKELWNDKEIVLEAVKRYSYSLQYIPKELWNDKEIVLEAVKRYSYSLQYASEKLKNDKEIILEAEKTRIKEENIIKEKRSKRKFKI